MSRSRRSSQQNRNQQYAVSLFPFLAVLVCTLGVLIVLLVMAVQQAEVEVRHKNDQLVQQQAKQLKQIQNRAALAKFESDSIIAVRDDLVTRLSNAKNDRSYLEQQIKDTDRQAQDLFKALSDLNVLIEESEGEVEPTATSKSALEEELASLSHQIETAEENLQRLREDQSFQKEVEHAIIPFTGSGGTHRQPIFVECVSDGLILQPYGIKLRAEEFARPLAIGNMLDSALLTVREYWDKHGLAQSDAKPYPLLVVRPEGAQMYGLARRAMKSWDDEFGYELVSGDIKLRFGEPDRQLKTEIEAAVSAAKDRQQRIAQRRQFEQSSQWKSTLELARGLTPSASGGFETVGTGRPAHEILKRASFAKQSLLEDAGPIRSDREGSYGGELGEDHYGDLEGKSKDFRQGDQWRSLSDTPGSNPKFEDAQGAVTASQNSANRSLSHASRIENSDASQTGQSRFSGGSLATTRGANWALPAKTTGSQAYVRPIRLVCEPDQISVISQNRTVAKIPLGSQTGSAVDPLVSEIWKTIEFWGVAGNRAYWKPELRFSVLPGAERRFEELRVLLDDSGLLLESADER